MLLRCFGKNWALCDEIEVASDIIPRVGETVIIESKLNDTSELLVHDVTYELEGGKLNPVVKCQAFSTPQNRLWMLEANGWLPDRSE